MAKHGYKGACAPGTTAYRYETFSVGIFELIPKKSKHGLKAGPVKVRVRGRVEDDALVYKQAELIIKKLDHDQYDGPKTVTVSK